MEDGPKFYGRNLRDIPGLMELEEYHVLEWVPGDNGQGKPEAVALQFDIKAPFLPDLKIMVRLKSRAAVDRLVRLLLQYRDRVWPSDTGSECPFCGKQSWWRVNGYPDRFRCYSCGRWDEGDTGSEESSDRVWPE